MKVRSLERAEYTLVDNAFIDRFIAHASGEYVKIYLYLLSCVSSGEETAVSGIADFFDCTEADVCRALNYWERNGLLSLARDGSGKLSALTLLPVQPQQTDSREQEHGRTAGTGVSPDASGRLSLSCGGIPGPSSGSPAVSGEISGGPAVSGEISGSPAVSGEISGSPSGAGSLSDLPAGAQGLPVEDRDSRKVTEFPSPRKNSDRNEGEEMEQLVFIAETYYGRPLSRSESDNLSYFMNDLGMSADLIEYLLEYCVQKGHKTARYTEKVAQAWHTKGITTVDQARREVESFNSDYYTIFNALGVHGRLPAPGEREYMDRWLNEYRLPMEVIEEACRRTILQIQKPQLSYVEGILKSWHEAGVRTTADIAALDEKHDTAQAQARAAKTSVRSAGRFSNFRPSQNNWDEIGRRVAQAGSRREN